MDARAWANHSRSVPRSSTFAVDSVAFGAAAVCGCVWRFLHQHCCPSPEMAEMAENPGPYAENYQSVSNAVYGQGAVTPVLAVGPSATGVKILDRLKSILTV